MPAALRWALAVSLVVHVIALFWPGGGEPVEPLPVLLTAELRPAPSAAAPALVTAASAEKSPAKALSSAKPQKRRLPKKSVRPLLSSPASSPTGVAVAPESEAATEGVPKTAQNADPTDEKKPDDSRPPSPTDADRTAVPRDFPAQGVIHYRVERGESNFLIGTARHEWVAKDGEYRLYSLSETVGLVRLFKSVRVEWESRGKLAADGFRPESFTVRRNGRATRESAVFDWANGRVSVGDRGDAALDPGAQDLLSFAYQLGFMPQASPVNELPIATGKKYGIYQIQVLGDETLSLPMGSLRTRHLRAPGVAMELWLAYDYSLLPVKIRVVDNKSDTYLQIATEIQLSQP